jgi:hypothetical protein
MAALKYWDAGSSTWKILGAGLNVFEQPSDPGPQPLGSVWIDTDDMPPQGTGILPSGGAAGAVLTKNSTSDYDAVWTGPDAWHYINAAGEPAFQNGWGNYGANYAPASFRRDRDIVYIRGLVALGTAATVIFTLPAAYWPAYHQAFPIATSPSAGTYAFGHLNVFNDGRVSHGSGGTGFSSLWVSYAL